jgi:hypothetical protein
MVDSIEGYKLSYRYSGGDETDEPTGCGKDECTFGVYYRAGEGERTPGCSGCGIVAIDLSSVFDPTEPRYDGGAPEDFKTASAIELVRRSNRAIEKDPEDPFGILKVLSHGRSVALREILRYASDAGVNYNGTDLPDFALEA